MLRDVVNEILKRIDPGEVEGGLGLSGGVCWWHRLFFVGLLGGFASLYKDEAEGA